ncbi:MAG: YchF/TatD family DNA exonuclease [Sphaerochaetaceae bacterium]|jgi:TatD DNase family protein|nr:YchF/TatD family DNA exonuclease [Sphaerochaetaceae bacterium]
MKLFDTHAHIGLINIDQLEQLMAIQYAKRAGVAHIVSICNSLADFDQTYKNLSSAKQVFHAVGLSPTETGNTGRGWEERILEYGKLDRVIAVGETGLDYVKMFASKQIQIDVFVKHLELARKLNLPVIIHNREASSDIINILKVKMPPRGAIFHCFSEGPDLAFDALDLPVYFSFAGNITYKSVRPLVETVRMLPLDRILIESESPFMVPARYTHQRNKPEFIIENAKAIAAIKGIGLEECCDALYRNSLSAFHLSEND